MISKQSRLWTPEKAQGAVRAAFFARELAQRGREEPLRFTQLREIIGQAEGPISDRTLSKALGGMVSKGQLSKRVDGRYAWYTLVIPDTEKILALSRADTAFIDGAAKVGVIAESDKGWAIYGIPQILPRLFRRRLRKEALSHQERLWRVIEDVWEESVEAVLQPARRRVPRAVYSQGERALLRLHEVLMIGVLGLSYGQRHWKMMEEAIPGSLKTFQKAAGVD